MRAYHIIAGSQSEMDQWIKSLRAVQNADGQLVINEKVETANAVVQAGLDDDIIERDMVRITRAFWALYLLFF